jgi:D-alanyl-D-alanine carboxypeptidase
MITRTNKLIFSGIGIAAIAFLFFKRKKMLREELEVHLMKLHPAVQNDFRNFVAEVEEKTDYKVIITSTHRGYDKSLYIWQTNPLVQACCAVGKDHHFYGLAMDMVVSGPLGMLNNASSRQAWESTGIRNIARKYKMRWGIDFNNYYDPIHFDIPLHDINDMYNRAIAKYGSLPAIADNGNRLDFTGLTKRNYQPA